VTWWLNLKALQKDVQPDIHEGLAAYSEKQAATLLKMGMLFANQWYLTLVGNGLPVEWPEEFLIHRPTVSQKTLPMFCTFELCLL
jgi:hypothetical protein